ncbi:MAG TPA: type I polyketide synthase, partial [Gammaproteobacteria bacterium]|nr:type I polyketide synthase [Gammaproteobacteria bacterium]
MSDTDDRQYENDIAIIGMAGRFPGAKDVPEFWENLKNGVESIVTFSPEELQASGVDPELISSPDYVKAGAPLDQAEYFDAAFFGFQPKEAELMDPQHRMFLECAWSALEDAGYDSENYEGLIGVYGGVSRNTYTLGILTSCPDRLKTVAEYQATIASEKDYPATRVAYKLNLKGPAINIQTACSTSGVAIHIACQGIIAGDCDMALAGGGRVQTPTRAGYWYVEGGTLSPDGHCRTFDARAKGMVRGSGMGFVVLKRLSDAIDNGDCVHAIIKGSAMNNDGSAKIGFTAPSVSGQASVIADAQAIADVEADSITYIEAHGTGTPLGDPIEIAALTKAFRETTNRNGYCAIGSVKTNIGHLGSGATVASVIKTVLSLKNKILPPSLNFDQPNPQIDFANSPFFVNSELKEWQSNDGPRRAGVSSFGLGGTNVHLILEEAPAFKISTPSPRSCQLFLLSAKTTTSLETATENLASHLKKYSDTNLADAAYTLQTGRKRFNKRRFVVSDNVHGAVKLLKHPASTLAGTLNNDATECDVVFMFTGQGSQYINMGLGLYETEPVFRSHIDRCAELLTPLLDH